MPVVMNMRWMGVTPEQYDGIRQLVDWEGNQPPGGMHHVAWFDSAGLRVVDLWETADAFQQFVDERLMPGVAQVGIQGEPEVEIQPVHAIYAPLEAARV